MNDSPASQDSFGNRAESPKPIVPKSASEALRPTLLAIKHGEVPTADVMALARQLTPKLEGARQTSPLPRHPDVAAAERVLRSARAEVARRAVQAVPGPWGADAPSPPEARYDD